MFHVAGVEGIAGPWKHYYENNTLGTRHVVEGCLTHGVGRLVYTSSPSVIFDGRGQEGVNDPSVSTALALPLCPLKGAGRAARAGGQWHVRSAFLRACGRI